MTHTGFESIFTIRYMYDIDMNNIIDNNNRKDVHAHTDRKK